ncbi:MAG: hypothetical protein U1F68_14900 [Gammaproteobacteria bacterium]
MTDEDKLYDLNFAVQRSIRYHQRRERFYDLWQSATDAVALIFGSVVLAVLLQQWGEGWVIAAAALVTISSTISLVVGTGRKARLHREIARRFQILELDMDEAEQSVEMLKKFNRIRREIELDEPPLLVNLNRICHNEVMRALGFKPDNPGYLPLSGPQRFFAHLFDIGANKNEMQT